MANDAPVACTLGAAELERRLARIARIGAESLVTREADGDRHLLRFRPSAATQGRLEELVAAEAECCPFLDLSLGDEGGELVLSIAAPQNARGLADELAGAFSTIE